MYNQFQNSFGTSSFGSAPYQGQRMQSFQPAGNVQSYYGQNQQQYGMNPSAEAYHTANYRGNQPGHDQGLRGDSFYPAQQQGGRGQESNYGSFRYGVRGNEQAYGNMSNVSSPSQFGFTAGPAGGMGSRFSSAPNYGTGYNQAQTQGFRSQPQSLESYHLANYRGNQQGHDQSLRGDSFNPAQQQGARGYESNYGSFRYGVRGNEQAFSNVNDVSSQFGFTTVPVSGGISGTPGFSSQMQQPQSTEAYHLANYRGNQQGHDQGLRGDSFYPAQQQGGQAYESNYSGIQYGVRGNEQSYNQANNVSSQFGFSSSPMSGYTGQSNFF